MKTYRYSGEELKNLYPERAHLGEVFKAVEDDSRTKGEFICQFRVNGMSLPEAEEKKADQMSLADVDFVEILADTPENLLTAVISNWVEDLPKLISRVDDLALALREKGLQTQYTPFVKAIDQCQFLIDSLISIRSFPIAADVVQSPKWDECERTTVQAVEESMQSFEKKDSNWLADVIEYDLANSLQNWLELMRELHGKLSSGCSKDREAGV
ncbi:MAG: hypothetical protein C5B49_12665 [Bdellovibrio sp.]|nr:MAG: hypothetical protein C5B49_12665 [Bdellovibrio sp.]